MKKLIFVFLAIILFGCTNELPDQSNKDVVETVDFKESSLLIDRQPQYIDSKDAAKIAALLKMRDGKMSRSGESQIPSSVETIFDDITGEPLFFIVNWPEKSGFSVVSSVKTTVPILAHSENGNFDYRHNESAKALLTQLKLEVQVSKDNQNDSLKRETALMWAMYEKADVNLSRAIDYELQQRINKKIAAMEAKGWKYAGGLTAAGYRLPENEYNALKNDAKYLTDPAYDYEEVSLCFLSDNKENAIGPLLQTQWYQTDLPFNAAAPNGIAGCVPLALAQICYYHRFPTKYNWTLVPAAPTKGIQNNTITLLMNEIKAYCNPSYLEGVTTATLSDASYTLNALGFQNTSARNISSSDLKSAITARNPVFVTGSDDGSGIGHAWVCDGFYEKKTNGIISVVAGSRLQAFERDENEYYDIGFTPKLYIETPPYAQYYHVNLGWEGVSDGWYYFSTHINTPSYRDRQYIITARKP